MTSDPREREIDPLIEFVRQNDKTLLARAAGTEAGIPNTPPDTALRIREPVPDGLAALERPGVVETLRDILDDLAAKLREEESGDSTSEVHE